MDDSKIMINATDTRKGEGVKEKERIILEELLSGYVFGKVSDNLCLVLARYVHQDYLLDSAPRSHMFVCNLFEKMCR
ncbi:hypothetical protein VNO77_07072 [Canavalia gladiata]|uniref:Uncharacterized protein n=1 Tax=Canavalia gladiata TaxID=3824 RepID=A0AAN9M889_CANGL